MTLALLLAAGRGARLGTPKALMDLAGLSAMERCLDALREGGATELRCVLGPDMDEAAALAAARGAQVVVNPQPHRGQTTSLKAGLSAGPITGDGFLLQTVDHPLVRPEDVRTLLSAFASRAPDIAVVVPSVEGRRGHPGLYAAALAGEFLALDDDEPAHRVLRSRPARVLHVPMDDPWLVRDIDTPQDLADARAHLRGGPA
ncbi:MAG: nucleotidyltransferase family protein [Planctomycetota bacterium]|jgi:nicotine blue oxidoreductase